MHPRALPDVADATPIPLSGDATAFGDCTMPHEQKTSSILNSCLIWVALMLTGLPSLRAQTVVGNEWRSITPPPAGFGPWTAVRVSSEPAHTPFPLPTLLGSQQVSGTERFEVPGTCLEIEVAVTREEYGWLAPFGGIVSTKPNYELEVAVAANWPNDRRVAIQLSRYRSGYLPLGLRRGLLVDWFLNFPADDLRITGARAMLEGSGPATPLPQAPIRAHDPCLLAHGAYLGTNTGQQWFLPAGALCPQLLTPFQWVVTVDQPRAHVLLGDVENKAGTADLTGMVGAFSAAVADVRRAGFDLISERYADSGNADRALLDPNTRALWIGAHAPAGQGAAAGPVMVDNTVISAGYVMGRHGPRTQVRLLVIHTCSVMYPSLTVLQRWRTAFPNATIIGWANDARHTAIDGWQRSYQFPDAHACSPPPSFELLRNRRYWGPQRRTYTISSGRTVIDPDPAYLRDWRLTPAMTSRLGPGSITMNLTTPQGLGVSLEVLNGRVVADSWDTQYPNPDLSLSITDAAWSSLLRDPATYFGHVAAGSVTASSRRAGVTAADAMDLAGYVTLPRSGGHGVKRARTMDGTAPLVNAPLSG